MVEEPSTVSGISKWQEEKRCCSYPSYLAGNARQGHDRLTFSAKGEVCGSVFDYIVTPPPSSLALPLLSVFPLRPENYSLLAITDPKEQLAPREISSQGTGTSRAGPPDGYTLPHILHCGQAHRRGRTLQEIAREIRQQGERKSTFYCSESASASLVGKAAL